MRKHKANLDRISSTNVSVSVILGKKSRPITQNTKSLLMGNELSEK